MNLHLKSTMKGFSLQSLTQNLVLENMGVFRYKIDCLWSYLLVFLLPSLGGVGGGFYN